MMDVCAGRCFKKARQFWQNSVLVFQKRAVGVNDCDGFVHWFFRSNIVLLKNSPLPMGEGSFLFTGNALDNLSATL